MMTIENGSRLRYLGASSVQSPAGDLSHLALCTTDDHRLGRLDGVLIDPMARRVRFFVVAPQESLRRKYLLPADCLAQMLPAKRALRLELDSDDIEDCEEFEDGAVQPFSDDDLLDCLFAAPAAD